MLHTPFYDPTKTYEENYQQGPFGAFADKKIYEEKGEPKYEFFGNKIYFPFGIPAGPLLNGAYVKAALDKGFDLVTYKTVRTRLHPSNPLPNVLPIEIRGDLTLEMAEKGVVATKDFRDPLAITNSFGVPSFAPDIWQKDMRECVSYAKKGQRVIGSFQGTTNINGNVKDYIQDFVSAAGLVKETGVKILEANLSCPNEGSSHLLCFDIERTRQIVEAIKNAIGNTSLIIKIAYFEDNDQLKTFIKAVGKIIDGISAINTIPAKIVDAEGNPALTGGRLISGICGEPVKWAGLEMAKRLKGLRDELSLSYAIIGVGGVTTREDYKEYREAGADVVMSATGSMWNPYLAQEIKEKYL